MEIKGWGKSVAKQHSPADREPKGALNGWLIRTSQGYYTGNQRSVLECWTPFPKFAKRYRRQAWAQKIAAQFDGQAVSVVEQIHTSNG
jgi:hypothetical protein